MKITLAIAAIITLIIVGENMSRTDGSIKGVKTQERVEITLTPTKTPTPTSTIRPQIQNTEQTSNEPIIDCTGPDGGHLKITQKECDDFNNAWRNKNLNTSNDADSRQTNSVQVPITKSTTQSDLINCQTKMGIYKLTQYECDEYQKTLSRYIDCQTAFYHYSWLTQEECEQKKKEDSAFVDKLNNIDTSQPTTTPDNSYNQQQNGQCKIQANQWYTNQGTQCSGSCTEAIKQIAFPEYQQKLKDCDNLYPI